MQQFAVKILSSLYLSLAYASNVMEGATVSSPISTLDYTEALFDAGYNNWIEVVSSIHDDPVFPDGS